MTEWLDIHLESLSSEERLLLIVEVYETLTVQELLKTRDLAEQKRLAKLEEAKTAVLDETRGK